MTAFSTSRRSRLGLWMARAGVSRRILLVGAGGAAVLAGLLFFEALTPSVCYLKNPAELVNLGACFLLISGLWGWGGLRIPVVAAGCGPTRVPRSRSRAPARSTDRAA